MAEGAEAEIARQVFRAFQPMRHLADHAPSPTSPSLGIESNLQG